MKKLINKIKRHWREFVRDIERIAEYLDEINEENM